eukprot:scaffold7429_cov123-Isochrysis_galbana.AAC.5
MHVCVIVAACGGRRREAGETGNNRSSRTPAPSSSSSSAAVCCRDGIECSRPAFPAPPRPTVGSVVAKGSGAALWLSRRPAMLFWARCGGGGPSRRRSAPREAGMGLSGGRRAE